jgi:CheY-like chemotaxis protein
LGLAIASRLVGMMGGRIWAESRLGHGSTFHVVLPLAAMSPAPAAGLAEPCAHTQGGARILVAEDVLINQRLIVALLTRHGYEAVLVEDGLAAVESFRNERFDLVLMDVQMPRMNGLEATVLIRDLERANGWSTTPIIALTANAMASDREACLAAGMDDFVSKPFKWADIQAKLNHFQAAGSNEKGPR